MGKTYIKCARLLPSLRPCRTCSHIQTCDLYDESNPFDINSEHAQIEYNEEQREFAKLVHVEE